MPRSAQRSKKKTEPILSSRKLPELLRVNFTADERQLYEAGRCCQMRAIKPDIKYCGDPSDTASEYGYCTFHLYTSRYPPRI